MKIRLDKRIAERSAELTLVQGIDGVASRPIKATLNRDDGIRILSDGKTKQYPVSAIYADTLSRIRSHKMLQAIWDAMLAEMQRIESRD